MQDGEGASTEMAVRWAPELPSLIHYNSSGVVQHSASERFIDAIRRELARGYGFIPFIGAGFSVSAGIPIVEQLRNYLRRCICVALGAEDDESEGARELWNPRTDQWPPFIDRKRPERGQWQDLVYKKFETEREKGNKGNSLVFQEAFGAMAEWRASLYFLSRLILDPTRRRYGAEPHLLLGLPQREVIDACFREVMRNKKPSLNHMMLGALSGPLRMDLILSTNFDDLVEQAFESKSIPLQPFEVHLGINLPDLSAVSRVRALIKLHGSLYSLRADYSLDASPSEEDKDIFLQYLTGEKKNPYDPMAEIDLLQNKCHLLVMGVGASERRSLDFIEHAWKHSDCLQVFWVCYSQFGVDKVKEFYEKRLKLSARHHRRFHILQHGELGLLLLHLYQAIRKTLPPTGAIFPSVTRIPLPPLPLDLPEQQPTPHPQTKDPDPLDSLRAALKKSESMKSKLVVVTGEFGVTSACAQIFRESEATYSCIWIDLNDVSSADNLFEAFQEASYFKLGQVDWTPLYATKDHRPRGDEIDRIGNSGTKPWLVFLNARERPGANRSDSPYPNGWLDETPCPKQDQLKCPEADKFGCLEFHQFNAHKTSSSHAGSVVSTHCPRADKSDKSSYRHPFLDLLDELCSQSGRITIVLVCRMENSDIVHELHSKAICIELPLPNKAASLKRDKQDVVRRVLDWIEEAPTRERESRRRFLFSLVLMQRPRFLATAWDESVNIKEFISDFDRQKNNWLNKLQECGLLRWLDGGFIWLHSDIRQEIRARLRERAGAADEERHIHKRLAVWYQKVFAATGVAPAIFEAIDHYCLATACVLRQSTDCSNENENRRNLTRARFYVTAARRLLRDHSFLIQTHGHPRNSIRRLDCIRDFWHSPDEALLQVLDRPGLGSSAIELKRGIAKLQCMAVEVARAIFREIGEDGEAYERQREVQQRMIEDRPLAWKNILPFVSYANRRSRMEVMVEKLASMPGSGGRDCTTPRPQALVRWWRWCAMLAIASRSYDEAERSLFRGLSVPMKGKAMYEHTIENSDLLLQSFKLSQLKYVHVTEAEEGIDSQQWELNREDLHKLQLEILHSLELSVYLLLLRASTLDRLNSMLGGLTADPHSNERQQYETNQLRIQKYLDVAKRFAGRGLKLADQLQTNGSYEGKHDFDAIWCRSRLLMHSALLSGLLGEDKHHSRHAMSHMGDAQACLNIPDPARNRADLSLIELHRAEIRLQEASHVKLRLNTHESQEDLAFEHWTYNQLRGSLEEATNATRLLISDMQQPQLQIAETLREVKSRATDVMRYLHIAEPMLLERRRNVWWTTWFFERRLRAMALILWTSVVEYGVPIPFLGLEATMRLAETEADVLLNTSVRMIRVDEYRLATAVLSYASCARALQVRLAVDTATVQLPERIKEMRSNLENAITELEQVGNRRRLEQVGNRWHKDGFDSGTSVGGKQLALKDGVDKDASRLVEFAKKLVLPVITSLKN